ncbi:Hypothetical protein R9X50_00251800 [Acrodontium crateriforme]|uniref:Urease accessory protein UreD n=1 Tax=Acrodontium crateriforme TaxID=150365 RepID=A0AAQ3R933_9PEZI|nr:Hypothetical protein R9X50_00251800 [Acrodontium crateriforme]
MSNPFQASTSEPGRGTIHVSLLLPNTARLTKASYQYPLKLVSPAPTKVFNHEDHQTIIHTVYLLTYGGGLVAGDAIDLDVILERTTRLVLLTQGSTKLFKAPNRDTLSKQRMSVSLAPGSALCYLPDPVQPFENSCFEQRQIYNLTVPTGDGQEWPSLCALDWVSNGRPANGENWSFFRYGSRNEVYLSVPEGTRRLVLRDNVLLDQNDSDVQLSNRMASLSVFGTLILRGPCFHTLGEFFMDEFKVLPRIGGRKWDSGSEDGDQEPEPREVRRALRQRQESTDGLLWSAASVRGSVVVKFGSPGLEGGRRWLRNMLVEEGTIAREFGESALLCLR